MKYLLVLLVVFVGVWVWRSNRIAINKDKQEGIELDDKDRIKNFRTVLWELK